MSQFCVEIVIMIIYCFNFYILLKILWKSKYIIRTRTLLNAYCTYWWILFSGGHIFINLKIRLRGRFASANPASNSCNNLLLISICVLLKSNRCKVSDGEEKCWKYVFPKKIYTHGQCENMHTYLENFPWIISWVFRRFSEKLHDLTACDLSLTRFACNRVIIVKANFWKTTITQTRRYIRVFSKRFT